MEILPHLCTISCKNRTKKKKKHGNEFLIVFFFENIVKSIGKRREDDSWDRLHCENTLCVLELERLKWRCTSLIGEPRV